MEDLDGPIYYRMYLPLREVNRSADGITAQVIDAKECATLTDDALGERDIYMMARMYLADCEEFIGEVHRRGALFVFDSDDDLTEDFRLVSGRGREFKKMLGAADYITVSTPALAAHFTQYTQKPPVVLRNHIDTDWMASIAAKAQRLVEGLTIGFSGSPTHWRDWYVAAVPLQRIVHDFDVVPVVHGEPPRYLGFLALEVVRLGGVPFAAYPVLLKQFDVVLCAVDSTDEFNTGKSAAKALECMAVGAVPICSRFQPYVELYEAGAPVILVEEDSRDGWYGAMKGLIQDGERRRHLSSLGADWVRENRDMVNGGWKQWARFFRSIAG